MPFPVQSLSNHVPARQGKPGDSVGMGAPSQRQYLACSCHSINICSVTTEVQSESVLSVCFPFAQSSPPMRFIPFFLKGFPLL